MALLFIDGFDHYDHGNDAGEKGYSGTNINFFAPSTTYKRFNGEGIHMQSSIINAEYPLDTTYTSIYMGIAIRLSTGVAPAYSSASPMFGFYDENGVVQVRIHVTAAREIVVYNGAGVLLGTSAIDLIPATTWLYIEARCTVHNTTGVVVVRINNTEVLNLTNKDTRYGTEYIKKVRFALVRNIDTWFDDFYIDSSQFHGDVTIKTFWPDSDETHQDWTPSAGNRFQCVDEQGPNDDTDYISSATVTDQNSFGFTTGALADTVVGVQLNNHRRAEDAGATRKTKGLCRSNGSDYLSSESPAVTAGYLYHCAIWELDPDDSAAWTQVKIEAAEFGINLST